MANVAYTRHLHAAHCAYTGKPLHDIENWTVPGLWTDARPESVPADAQKHHGFIKAGVQFVVWSRTAMPSPAPCSRVCRGDVFTKAGA
jgi:hypothetical protein